MEDLDYQTPALGRKFRHRFIQRFEMTKAIRDRELTLEEYQERTHRVINAPLNIMFSQIHTVNNRRSDLYRLNIIRLYLIKSFRGRCHALGKPVRGQRTWSNA